MLGCDPKRLGRYLDKSTENEALSGWVDSTWRHFMDAGLRQLPDANEFGKLVSRRIRAGAPRACQRAKGS